MKRSLLVCAVGLLAGFGASFLVVPRYVSSAVVSMDLRQARFGNLANAVLSRESLSSIIQAPHLRLYPEAQQHKAMEDVVEEMRRDLSLSSDATSATIRIRFGYPNRFKAQAVAQAIINRLFDEAGVIRDAQQTETRRAVGDRIRQLRVRLARLEGTSAPTAADNMIADFVRARGLIEVLDPPSLPVTPVFPNRRVFAFLGLATAVAYLLVSRRRTPTPTTLRPAPGGPSPHPG